MAWPQTTEELSIQVGVIRSVNIVEGNNVRTITINVMSLLDSFIMQGIPIDSPLHAQFVPVVGQYVLLLRSANNFTRVIAYFGEKLFDAPLQPGEFMTEGGGGGFMHLNNEGDVTIGDGYMSNVQRMLAGIGISMTADGYSLNVKNVGQINITPKDDKLGNDEQIEIIKTQGTNVSGRIVLTNDKTMIYSPSIEMGLDPNTIAGASDLKGGVVISNNPLAPKGPYNFDLVTGLPIPCSGTVRASI